MTKENTFRWWHKGDLDGFFGLFVDNLIQLILIVVLCGAILKMPGEMIYGRILPGVAVSLLIGNIFYAFQAKALYMRTGQTGVTALPYGVNTVSLFAYILFVMKPVLDQTNDVELAWRVGLAAMTVSLIEKHYRAAAGWAVSAAVISATGLMHGYRIVNGAVVNAYGPAYTWPFVAGYLGIAAVFLALWYWQGPTARQSHS